MNNKQKELQSLLMTMPRKDYPESLKKFLRDMEKIMGSSGGVRADLIERWILNLHKESA